MSLNLIPGNRYRYQYTDGTTVEFDYDSTLTVPTHTSSKAVPTILGIIQATSRKGQVVSPKLVRIIQVSSVDPTRMYLIGAAPVAPVSGFSLPHKPTWAITPSPVAAKAKIVPCRTHTPVNVGFHSIRMVCKVCDTDLPSDPLAGRTAT